MRGVPNPRNDQPQSGVPSLLVVVPGSLTLIEPMPEELAALGREMLEMVPRKQRGSLAAYRQAANDLSRMLGATGVRVKPKVLYYTALRVKWIKDSTIE